jgi:hypothetical protein
VQLLDTGTLVDALPDEGLAADTVGTIVHIFERPNRAFQVEFTDDDVETVAFVALLPAALRPCDRRTATTWHLSHRRVQRRLSRDSPGIDTWWRVPRERRFGDSENVDHRSQRVRPARPRSPYAWL